MNFVSFKALAVAKFYHFHLILLFSFQNLKRFFSVVEKSSVLLIQIYSTQFYNVINQIEFTTKFRIH